MIQFVLYDTPRSRAQFYPLSLTRPIGELRYGLLTLAGYWSLRSGQEVHCLSTPLLSGPMPACDHYICMDATVLPDEDCWQQVKQLQPGESIEDAHGLVAYATRNSPVFGQLPLWMDHSITVPHQPRLCHTIDLIAGNSQAIRDTFERATAGRTSAPVGNGNQVIGEALFLEPGATLMACTVNTLEGPVYIGRNALVMEGTTIRGPVAIGEGAVVKMGSRLYPGTNIGAGCTAGGEIKNAILHAFTNKAHDGYLGDSYIGAWCNLGAGTNCSNVKNTASSIEIWQQDGQSWIEAGQKCGVVMGDYSRTAIQTSLSSGTTIGICCSIHEPGPYTRHIPSFSWGPGQPYLLDKALRHIANWMQWKGQELDEQARQILTDVYNH